MKSLFSNKGHPLLSEQNHPDTPIPSRKGGFALILVLTLTSLLTLLIVHLFQMSHLEAKGTRDFWNQQQLDLLESNTINLVINQIRSATTRQDEPWASQPGAIRTYKSSGEFSMGYRLFSSQRLQEASVNELTFSTEAPPVDWQNSPHLWVDLNEPVIRDQIKNYPILHPGQGPEDWVDGFSIDLNFPGASTNGLHAPMPVQWLYYLQDGHVGTLNSMGVYEGSGTPSADNPIVGRIAYWTDDETSKLNLNTASEPTFWDTPRVDSSTSTNQGVQQSRVLSDKAYARFQPIQREYQRYPGHPAMTALGPVLFPKQTPTPTLKESIYTLIPRIANGGSLAGTQALPANSGKINPDSDRLFTTPEEIVFASQSSNPNTRTSTSLQTPDEIDQRKFFLTTSSRSPEITLYGTPRISIWPTHWKETNPQNGQSYRTTYDQLIRFCSTIGQQKYFYGFQRGDANHPTHDWTAITRNQEVLRLLQRLTDRQVPGFGGSFQQKYGSTNRDQLLVQILDYIRSTNLYDDNLEPKRYSSANPAQYVQFTGGKSLNQDDTTGYKGHGEVTPLLVPPGLGNQYASQASNQSNLMGFGRFFTFSEVGLLFLCGADGDEQDPVMANRLSNIPSNLMLPGPIGAKTLLNPREKRVQMMVLFEWFSPSQGWSPVSPDFSVEVDLNGGQFYLDGQNLEMPTLTTIESDAGHAFSAWGHHPWGGTAGYRGFLKNRRAPARGVMPADPGLNTNNSYGLVSAPVTVVDRGDGLMSFVGPDKITVKILAGSSVTHTKHLVQTIDLQFPNANFPIPVLKKTGTPAIQDHATSTTREYWWSFHRSGAFGSGVQLPEFSQPGGRLNSPNNHSRPYDSRGTLIRPEDTFKTLVPYHGDYRLIAASEHVPLGVFQPSSSYFSSDQSRSVSDADTGKPNTPIKSHFTGTSGSQQEWLTLTTPPPEFRLVPQANYHGERLPDFPMFSPASSPTSRLSAVTWQRYGDFDIGVATTADGAFINKPDEGNTYRIESATEIPYFTNNWIQIPAGETYFSPNRQIPGPGMFGSLPTMLTSGNVPYQDQAQIVGPWQTLLFRAQKNHPGAQSPPDHLWMDFFWMPMVEPYALSEPASTTGKVNLNYQMLPFPHLRRATALHGVLRSEEMLMLRTNQANVYKSGLSEVHRFPIKIEETLKQFDTRFQSGKLFLSASQLCELHLVPDNHPLQPTAASMDGDFWSTHSLTSDNARERPYTNLQPRLTVRSNSYQIHYRVQTIRKARSTPPNQFIPAQDQITSERRGSQLIERYLNPEDERILDHATQPDAPNLETLHQYRTLTRRRFNP